MRRYTAIYDACVLYPALLRDLLMHLACSGLFAARWTDEIHDEWVRNLLAKRPDLKPEQLLRTRSLMNASVPDCLVTGHLDLASRLRLPDPDDRHVLAAAIVARADVIVTFNLKDFPTESLQPYEIEAQHPDDFILCQIDLRVGPVLHSMKQHRAALKNPPKNVTEYFSGLRATGLTQTVARLEEFEDLL